jgi:6-phosphogluconolactonase
MGLMPKLAPLALIVAAAALLFPTGAGAARHVYVAGYDSSSVGAAVVGSDGSLTPVAGSPFATGAVGPEAVVLSPGGSSLFASHFGVAGPMPLAALGVAANGALSSIPGSPFGGDTRTGLAVTPDGRFLYGLDQFHDGVVGFSIGESGAPAVLPRFPVPSGGSLPVAVAVTPDGTRLYVVNRGAPSVQGFAIAGDGGLTPLSTAEIGATPFAIAITPDGRHLYVANSSSDDISAFEILSDGSLAPLGGSPFATGGSSSIGLAMSPDGSHLYTTNRISGDLSAFGVSSDGDLNTVAGSPFAMPAAADAPIAGAVTPDSSYLYVASATGDNVAGFGIGDSGSLEPLPGSPYALGVSVPDVWSIAISPDQPPAASFSAPAAAAGTPTSFDASPSTDADSDIARYAWDFGDGAADTTASPTTSHTYTSPGRYQVKLELTDREGCSTNAVHTGQTSSFSGGVCAVEERSVSVGSPDTLAPPPASGVLPATARSCVSTRRFHIRLRAPRGRRIVSAEARLRGKRLRTRLGPPATVRIDLRGRPRGRYRVTIRIRLDNGRSIRRTRTYRTCVTRTR